MKKEIQNLSEEILKIEYKLNCYIPSTLWVSDLHGEGKKFARTIKGRFGMLYQTCREALPHFLPHKKLLYITHTIQKRVFSYDASIGMDTQDVVQCLVDILKYKLENKRINPFTEENIFTEAIQRLVANQKIPHIWYEEEWFNQKLVYHLSKTILEIFLDYLIVLGDVFDRGPQPDKIVRILQNNSVKNSMSLIFGNHDILWMGACAGNQSLIAEAMRITCRYDHLAFLDRMGIDYSLLQTFAQKTYPAETITGNFKAKDPSSRSMEKALSIIQFKLEEETINRHPEYKMESRLCLDGLSQMLQKKDIQNLRDTHFPTLNFDKPQELSKQEKEIVADLTKQFLSEEKLKHCIQIFFEKGRVYHIYNNILSIHALVPSNEKGEFESFLQFKGKALLDYIQKTISVVGENYLAGKSNKEADISLFFYLWCGPQSPFFGKDAMKTFERYFLKDKELHKEKKLFWEENVKQAHFQKRMKEEFLIDHVVYGHIPRDHKKGQSISSGDGFAINIDGGFAEAYLNRGHALVQTPKMLYGIILQTEGEPHKDNCVLEQIDIIKEYSHPLTASDTFLASILKEKKKILRQKLKQQEDS